MPEGFATESGILLPNTQTRGIETPKKLPNSFQITQSGLVAPRNLGVQTQEHSVLIPEGVTLPTGVEVPTQEQTLELTIQPLEDKQTQPVRKGSEIALAFHNPHLFLRRVLENKLPESQTQSQQWSDIWRVWETVVEGQQPTAQVDHSLLDRVTTERTYKDRYTNQKEKSIQTKPGILEQIGVETLRIAGEQTFKGTSIGEKLLATYGRAMLEYRRTGNCVLPELSDVAHEALNLLCRGNLSAELRVFTYELLEQVRVPDSLREQLLTAMDSHHDLHHPLAFQLTTELMISNPDSAWLVEQRRRAATLGEQLARSPQELFDNFEVLKKLSSGIVMSNFPTDSAGKIGLEIEYRSDEYVAEQTDFSGWVPGEDGGNLEMRRNDGNLEYTAAYAHDLSILRRWFMDHRTTNLSSIHIHLDQARHPYPPELSGLLLEHQGFFDRGKGSSVRDASDDTGTWEMRSLFIPASKDHLSAATVHELVCLLIDNSKSDSSDGEKSDCLHLPEESYQWEQLVWGHICRCVDSPQARLSALLVLDRFPFALEGYRPDTLFASIRVEDQVKAVRALWDAPLGEIQLSNLCTALGKNTIGDESSPWNIYASFVNGSLQLTPEKVSVLLSRGERFANAVGRKIRENNDFASNVELLKQLWPALHKRALKKMLISSKHGYMEDNKLVNDFSIQLVAGLETDPEFRREMITHLRHSRLDDEQKELLYKLYSQEPDKSAKRGIFAVLALQPGDQREQMIVEGLQSVETDIREVALKAIGSSRPKNEEIVSLLVQIVANAPKPEAELAVSALNPWNEEKISQQLVAAIDNCQNLANKSFLISALGCKKDQAARMKLTSFTDDPDVGCRRAAMKQISRLRYEDNYDLFMRHISDQDPETKLYAYTGLQHHSTPETMILFTEALNSEDSQLRTLAEEVLTDNEFLKDQPSAGKVLALLAEHESAETRVRAVFALADHIEDKRVIDVLIERLGKEEGDYIKSDIISVLGEVPLSQIESQLWRLVEKADPTDHALRLLIRKHASLWKVLKHIPDDLEKRDDICFSASRWYDSRMDRISLWLAQHFSPDERVRLNAEECARYSGRYL